jgi:hypothetical protein
MLPLNSGAETVLTGTGMSPLVTFEIAAICLMTDVRPVEFVPVINEADISDEFLESR